MTTQPIDVANTILSHIVHSLGPFWERRLSDRERDLVRACCDDAALLGLRALATPFTRHVQLELLREKARIHERLSDSLALGNPGRLAEVFWEGFRTTVNGAVAIAFAAL